MVALNLLCHPGDLRHLVYASVVKNLPAMQEAQEMQFRSLGQEKPLEHI